MFGTSFVVVVALLFLAPALAAPASEPRAFGRPQPKKCTSIQYLSGSTCTTCPAGYSCNGGTKTACGTGAYSSAGSGTCTTCPAGFSCSTSTTSSPEPCGLDQYAPAGSSSCSFCPLGTWSWGGGGIGSCTSLSTPSTPQTSAGVVRRARPRAPQCPEGHSLCTVLSGPAGSNECVDTRSDLESCGGCHSIFGGEGAGRDCSAIDGASSVSCQQGRCVVEQCRNGWEVAEGGEDCVRV